MSAPAQGNIERTPGEPTGEGIWRVVGEVVLLWLVVHVLIRVAREVWLGTGYEIVLGLAPILYMYAPVLVCRLRGVDSWRYPLALPALADRAVWWRAIRLGGGLSLAVLLPFVGGYLLWHLVILGSVRGPIPWTWPSAASIALLVGYHLFFVAIPEEMFSRGYLQTRLDEAFRTRWTWMGATFGPGLPLVTFLFAIGHSIVIFQPWHLWIMVPGLAFGWLRARTGDVMAGAFFHAFCNITVQLLDHLILGPPPGGL
jgi:hypothetical protein